jgi:hypothetical protein
MLTRDQIVAKIRNVFQSHDDLFNFKQINPFEMLINQLTQYYDKENSIGVADLSYPCCWRIVCLCSG